MEKLSTCISGSFKFKAEIDELHEHFNDLGVTVIEPTKGWLYIATRMPERIETFRPLPQERGLSHRQVEGRFLNAILRADFLYLYNPYHYLGLSASLEIGFAHGMQKPVFAQEALTLANLDYDLEAYAYWSSQIPVATPEETVRVMRETKEAAG